jgi:hypothetical protein
MTFKFEILILGQQMKMNINKFQFNYLPIMDEISSNDLYLIQIINEIHRCKDDIHPYEIIHPCRWIKITLNFKLQVQNSKLRLYARA